MATINDAMETNDKLEEALVCLLESQGAADGDFGGWHRVWHLPRLNRAAVLLLQLFPQHAARALDRVKSPYDSVDAHDPAESCTTSVAP